MNLKEIVGLNLKYYRYKSGLSQEKFYTSLELKELGFSAAETANMKSISLYDEILLKPSK